MTAKYARDYTEGPLGKQIILYCLPLMASYLLQIMYNMADIAVIGQFSGAHSLAAVGSTSTLINMFNGVITGFAAGVSVVVGRSFGAKNEKSLEESIHSGAFIMLAIGLLLCCLGILISRPMLTLLSTKPEVIDNACLYIRIYFLGLPAMAAYNLGNSVLSAVGDTKRPLFYLSVSGALNVVLNLIFVLVFKLDVAGVALASVISQYVSGIWIIITIMKTEESYKLVIRNIRWVSVRAKMIISIGSGAAAQSCIFNLANLFVQWGINSFDANLVAGDAATNSVTPIIFKTSSAFYNTCATIMSQNYGAGKKDRVLSTFKYCMLYGLSYALVLGLIFIAFGHQILSIVTSDEAVIEAALYRFNIMCGSAFLCSAMDMGIAACRGLGKTFVPTIAVICGACVLRIVWIFTGFRIIGTITSLYIVYPLSFIATSIFEIGYFAYIWKKQTWESNGL